LKLTSQLAALASVQPQHQDFGKGLQMLLPNQRLKLSGWRGRDKWQDNVDIDAAAPRSLSATR
jgi:hypothetical protein